MSGHTAEKDTGKGPLGWLRAIFRPRPVRVISAFGSPTHYGAEIRRQALARDEIEHREAIGRSYAREIESQDASVPPPGVGA